MPESPERAKLAAQAEVTVAGILRAAVSWAQDVPPALTPAVRAVCVRLAEMVADQRHYHAPLPEAQERDRRQVLAMVAEGLRAPDVTRGIEAELADLADMRLKPTGTWSLTPGAQTEWVGAAIQFLELRSAALPAASRPDPYWADDVVAGIIASVKALIGTDELHARTEAEFAGMERAASPPEEA